MRFGPIAHHLLAALPLLVSLSAAACAAPEDDAEDSQTGLAAEAAQTNGDLEANPPSPAPQIDSAPDSETPMSSELLFPYVVQPACPGEGCMFDEWLACGAVPVYASLGVAMNPVTTLEANERFEVLTGAVVVDSPGIVAITRPSRPVPFLDGEDIFQPGDTLYVLDYLGEGFYNTWFKGAFFETAQFWPGPDFFTSSDYEYGGSVVHEGESRFWVQIRSDDQEEGWVDVFDVPLTAPNALDPDPLICR